MSDSDSGFAELPGDGHVVSGGGGAAVPAAAPQRARLLRGRDAAPLAVHRHGAHGAGIGAGGGCGQRGVCVWDLGGGRGRGSSGRHHLNLDEARGEGRAAEIRAGGAACIV